MSDRISARVLTARSAEPDGMPDWTIITVDAWSNSILVSRNWERSNGPLRDGDAIEFEIGPKVYSTVKEDFVKGLKRAPKEAVVE